MSSQFIYIYIIYMYIHIYICCKYYMLEIYCISCTCYICCICYMLYILYMLYMLWITGIFMDEVETEFPESQELQPFLWFHYIDNIYFLYGLMEKRSSLSFWINIVTYETSSCTVNFLDLNVSLKVTSTTKPFFATK